MAVPLESQHSLWTLELPLDPGCLVSPLCRHVICFCFQRMGTPDSPHPTRMLPGAGRVWEGWGSGQGSRMPPLFLLHPCRLPGPCGCGSPGLGRGSLRRGHLRPPLSPWLGGSASRSPVAQRCGGSC